MKSNDNYDVTDVVLEALLTRKQTLGTEINCILTERYGLNKDGLSACPRRILMRTNTLRKVLRALDEFRNANWSVATRQ